MKYLKIIFLFFVAEGFCIHELKGQTPFTPCAVDAFKHLYSQPGFKEKQDKFEEHWQNHFLTTVQKKTDIIPIVFHIIHDNGKGDITNALILKSLQELNDAFANRNYFRKPEGIDIEIQFCLAKQDPAGFPVSGITRTNSALTDVLAEQNGQQMKNLIQWNPLCYVNVWVVNSISSTVLGPGTNGYATLPGAHGSIADGIVVEAATLATDPANTTTLIHEMGHYLGLYHTFEGGCQNNNCLVDGDRVCDTPPDGSIAPSPCDQPSNSCSTDTRSGFTSDQNDPITNFMDYGHNFCRFHFTDGQKSRMKTALQTVRNSLLQCLSCNDPCPTPFVVNIITDSLTANIGYDFHLRSNPGPLVKNIKWLDNGSLISQNANYIHRFSSAGKHWVVLEFSGDNPLCNYRDSICIEVFCPIEFSHNLKDTACLKENTTLLLNCSPNPVNLKIDWYINNVLSHTGNSFPWTNPGNGLYKVYFTASNGLCTISSGTFNLRVGCKEICDNFIDDDGDQLIDGFDPDCCNELKRFYFNPCDSSCPRDLKDPFVNIKPKWKSDTTYRWHEANTPFVGDMDGDGDVEIIGYATNYYPSGQIASGGILIIDGKTGLREGFYDLPLNGFSGNLAVADIDRNGYGDIICNKSTFDCIEYRGAGNFILKWRRPNTGVSLQQPYLTDFNQDGRPEIVLHNGIYDSYTGRSYVPMNFTMNRGWTGLIFGTCGGAAVDVLPDNFCAACDGLEFILGNEIYAVDLDLTTMTGSLSLQIKYQAGSDGYTSVVDFDLDGDLDVIVLSVVMNPDFTSVTNIFVYEAKTGNAITPVLSFPGKFGRIVHPAVGDINGDTFPEIITNSQDFIHAFQFKSGAWIELFKIRNNDQSGMSGLFLFDFDADGNQEIIQRDETQLKIIRGRDGSTLYSTPCQSGTGNDHPSIADIDGDREAELLCSCHHQLIALEPTPKSWAFTRPVMNQTPYFNVNIQDNLQLPMVQQLHHLPGKNKALNTYLSQYAYKEFYAADFFGTFITQVCKKDSLIITIEICNKGPADYQGALQLSIYKENPLTNNTIIWQNIQLMQNNWIKDTCINVSFCIPNYQGQIYLLINENGMSSKPLILGDDGPHHPLTECDYTNNLINIAISSDFVTPDLGPDIRLCDFGVQTLFLPVSYKKYLWIDGSEEPKLTIYNPGLYWVEVIDDCGIKGRDSINIILDSITKIDLGPDLSLCKGDSITIALKGLGFSWVSTDLSICDTCAVNVLRPDTSTTYHVNVKTQEGCFSYDSLHISILPLRIKNDTFNLCHLDSVLFNNFWINEDTTIVDTIKINGSCDSVHIVNLLFDTTKLNIGDTYSICPSDSLILSINGFASYKWSNSSDISCHDCADVTIKPSKFPASYTLTVTSTLGCEYADTIYIVKGNEIQISKQINLCYGDSIFIDNKWVYQDGLYSIKSLSTTSCDTVTLCTVIFDKQKLDVGPDKSICIGDSILISVAGFSSYQWSASTDIRCPQCPSTYIVPSQSSNKYYLKVISNSGCEYLDSLYINLVQDIVEYDTINICQGDSILWNNQSINKPGTYYHKKTSVQDCDTIISLHVLHHPIRQKILQDQQMCREDTLRFYLPDDITWTWKESNGIICDTCKFVEIAAAANNTYSLLFTDSLGCNLQDSFTIDILPNPRQAKYYLICESHDSIYIDGKWYYSTGKYESRTSSSMSCDTIVEFRIDFYPDPKVEFVDTLFGYEGEKEIIEWDGDIVLVSGIDWQTSLPLSCNTCKNPELTFERDGLVLAIIESMGGCLDTIPIWVRVLKKESDIFIPSVFSPNNDNVNDFVSIFSIDQNAEVLSFQIYDRWGELLYQEDHVTINQFKGWNGEYKQKFLDPGVFIALARVKLSSGKIIELAQDITLVR